MKANLKVRIKNPWFWAGVITVLLSSMGVSPEMFTSWDLVWKSIVDVFTNPFLLFSTIFAILSVFIDPTTAGIGDSSQAMTYSKPRKDNVSDK